MGHGRGECHPYKIIGHVEHEILYEVVYLNRKKQYFLFLHEPPQSSVINVEEANQRP